MSWGIRGTCGRMEGQRDRVTAGGREGRTDGQREGSWGGTNGGAEERTETEY